MKKMGKILPVEAVVGAAMLKNKGWLRGRICFENEVVYTGVPTMKKETVALLQGTKRKKRAKKKIMNLVALHF